jgi:hypothetical protein
MLGVIGLPAFVETKEFSKVLKGMFKSSECMFVAIE